MFRNIPPVTGKLLVANLVMFALCALLRQVGGADLTGLLGLHFILAPDFHFFQLFTYLFMHAGVEHILFNMFSLWMFGCVVERTWGSRRFLYYYLFCGVGAGMMQEVVQLAQFYMLATDRIAGFTLADTMAVAEASAPMLNLWTTVGASGAIYGVLLAFGVTFPEERLFIFPIPFPIKGKWFVVFCVAVELALGFTSSSNVAHMAHLGGMLFGWLLIVYWRRQQRQAWSRSGGIADKLRSMMREHERRQKEQERERAQRETDRILDKIRRSGYDSLTREEKQKLFDNSDKL